ncbi:hypothetical protein SMG44B_60182 [Stenotrophomonas maltophilia]
MQVLGRQTGTLCPGVPTLDDPAALAQGAQDLRATTLTLPVVYKGQPGHPHPRTGDTHDPHAPAARPRPGADPCHLRLQCR